ncbi:MAG: hypothetical protein K2Q10_04350, partial [Rhodospirillales bacterium]|nr:hypothetical protein [Rhodospirillales bacterium]
MTSTCATDRLRHERDEARAELARLRDELAGCEAKADIATQVAGVAHDVATPVGIALMAASLLREHAGRM